jgi:hypothetical protein
MGDSHNLPVVLAHDQQHAVVLPLTRRSLDGLAVAGAEAGDLDVGAAVKPEEREPLNP